MPTPNHTDRTAWNGFIILIALVAAAVIVFNLQSIRELTRRHIDVVAMVKDAPGVRAGTEVWAEGVKVGRVRNVAITKRNDTAYVSLDLRLDEKATAIVTAESDVRASRQRFIGDPVIRLLAGAPGDPPLSPGDTIIGKPRLTPVQLLDRSRVLPAMLDSLMDTARLIEARVEARQARIAPLEHQVRAVGAAAAALTVELEEGSIGRMLDERTGLPARIGLLRLRVGDLGEAARRMADRYSADDGELASQLDALNRRVRDVETALAGLQARIEEGDGFVARVQADTAIQVAIRGIRLQLDSLVAEAHTIALRMLLP